eukprot:g5230.t1
MSPLQKNRKRSIDTSPASNLIYEDPAGLHNITVSVQQSLVKKRGEAEGGQANHSGVFATTGDSGDGGGGRDKSRFGEKGGLVTCTDDELLIDVGHDMENMVISVIATPKNKSRSRSRVEGEGQQIAEVRFGSKGEKLRISRVLDGVSRKDEEDADEDTKISDDDRNVASTTTSSFTTPKKNLHAAFRSTDANDDDASVVEGEQGGRGIGPSLIQQRGRDALYISPSHAPSSTGTCGAAPVSPMMSPSACIPCKFFALGICEFGDACRFSHDISPISPPSPLHGPHFQHLGHPMHPAMLMHSHGGLPSHPSTGRGRADAPGAYGIPAPPSPYMSHSSGAYMPHLTPAVPAVPAPPSPPPYLHGAHAMRHPVPHGYHHPRYRHQHLPQQHQQQNRRRRNRSSSSSSSSSHRARRTAKDRSRIEESATHDDSASSRTSNDATRDNIKSADDIRGKVWELTLDQSGCRVLQRLLLSEKEATLAILLTELKPHFPKLMVAPFGNYLFQKILEALRQGSKQLADVVEAVSSHIVAAATHVNGTRSAQKVIERCTDASQQAHIAECLRKRIRTLAVHSQATHVVLRGVDHFPETPRSIIIDGVAENLGDIVRNSHGCRVAQISFDVGTASERDRMVREIVKRALVLAKDVRGNYAVQHIVKKGNRKHVRAVLNSLSGHFVELSKQKFSSNVVEACLRSASEAGRSIVVKELAKDIVSLLNDQFGNYVVQRAMSESGDSARRTLLEATKVHVPALMQTSSGRRVVQRIQAQWPKFDLGASLPVDTAR